jgi:hypothetical protein
MLRHWRTCHPDFCREGSERHAPPQDASTHWGLGLMGRPSSAPSAVNVPMRR